MHKSILAVYRRYLCFRVETIIIDETYRKHIKTDHFLRYKQNTLHMVKKLRLHPLRPLDPETMRQIFKKHR